MSKITFALCLCFLIGKIFSADNDIVILATIKQDDGNVCSIILDRDFHILCGYSRESGTARVFFNKEGSSVKRHCHIELDPFRIRVGSTNYGESLRITRGGVLVDLDSDEPIKMGVRGTEEMYAAIVFVDINKALSDISVINYEWVLQNRKELRGEKTRDKSLSD